MNIVRVVRSLRALLLLLIMLYEYYKLLHLEVGMRDVFQVEEATMDLNRVLVTRNAPDYSIDHCLECFTNSDFPHPLIDCLEYSPPQRCRPEPIHAHRSGFKLADSRASTLITRPESGSTSISDKIALIF